MLTADDDDQGTSIMKGFRPVHDRVLVRRIEAEEKTVGGRVLSTLLQRRHWRATMVPV